jgi:hypothetical protein
MENCTYKVKIIKCPRCHNLLQLEAISKVSKRFAMQDLYLKMNYHLTNTCIVTRSSRQKVPVSVITVTDRDRTSKWDWDDTNFFIV